MTDLIRRRFIDNTHHDETEPAGRKLLLTLFTVIGSYMMLDNPMPVLFALAVAVSAGLPFPPLWGMLVGAPSGGKTEAGRLVSGIAHILIDHLTSPGLLSWAQGRPVPVGILTRVPNPAFVVVSDSSTVLATSDRGVRDDLFAALRCLFDGRYQRDLGNSMKSLSWEGKITFLAACTPALDNYSSHSDALGPRWLYCRLRGRDTNQKRDMTRVARNAVQNPHATKMCRDAAQKLAAAIVSKTAERATNIRIDETFAEKLDDVALVVCKGRAAVPRNAYGKRDITGLAIEEDPPRLALQLTTLATCLLALGMYPHEALNIATTCGLDTMPLPRRYALHHLATHDEVTAADIARHHTCSWNVANFALQELEVIGVAEQSAGAGAFQARPWKLAGPDADLIRSVFTNDH